MDYNEIYRDLAHICVINGEGILKFAEADPVTTENESSAVDTNK